MCYRREQRSWFFLVRVPRNKCEIGEKVVSANTVCDVRWLVCFGSQRREKSVQMNERPAERMLRLRRRKNQTEERIQTLAIIFSKLVNAKSGFMRLPFSAAHFVSPFGEIYRRKSVPANENAIAAPAFISDAATWLSCVSKAFALASNRINHVFPIQFLSLLRHFFRSRSALDITLAIRHLTRSAAVAQPPPRTDTVDEQLMQRQNQI